MQVANVIALIITVIINDHMNKCTNCGATSEENEKCVDCGTDMAKVEETAEEPTVAAEATEETAAEAAPEAEAEAPAKEESEA